VPGAEYSKNMISSKEVLAQWLNIRHIIICLRAQKSCGKQREKKIETEWYPNQKSWHNGRMLNT